MCCDGCGYEKCEFSSPRTGFNDEKNTGFEVNNRMTMLSHELGGSYTSLQTFSTVMGIPGMRLKTFQTHDKKVTAAEIESGSTLLECTAATIRQAYAETVEDLQEALDKGENPVINISVSYDGTWQKRGFTSLYGVGICINILTGLIIDYCVLSKYCHACKLAESKNLPDPELAAWKEAHAPGMESDTAKIMQKEYATLRRLNNREEEARDPDAYQAGGH
ncbi:uncharacterized protein LOC143295248 [Babylonia areolata]|uniref:uncharacterized protein LOC143295248 n=1 Tax=Babylonia areolata TaxID=304850 RepID=UPI003FD4B0ED